MPSKVIRTFSYDPGARRLRITFNSGRRYAYKDVPPDVADAMKLAFSKGEYFNAAIKDRFEFDREP